MDYWLQKPTFIQKHIEYHLVHKALGTNKTSTHLQYLFYQSNNTGILNHRLSSCLSINDLDYLDNDILDFIYSEDREEGYNYLNSNEFKEYFRHHGIDIPVIFKKSKSVLNLKNNIPILKFINIFMRHGLKLKTLIFLNTVIHNLQMNYFVTGQSSEFRSLQWKHIYLLLNTLSFNKAYTYKYLNPYNKIGYRGWLTDSSKYWTFKHDILTLIYSSILKLEPIFSFYIYKVDKTIYKSTRGKSGKYTFLWKYVSPHKRKPLVYYWLFKELRVKSHKKLGHRIHELLDLLINKPNQTWISKIRRFSILYVFKNCRKTLGLTYRTVMR